MELVRLHLLPNLDEENFGLDPAPPEQFEDLERERLHPVQHLHEVHHARLLQYGVLRPGPQGHLELLLADVHEAGALGPAAELVARAGIAVDTGDSLEEAFVPLAEVCIFGQGAVVGDVLEIEILELGPAAGTQIPSMSVSKPGECRGASAYS